MLISHCLKQGQLVLMVMIKIAFVILQERLCLRVKLFEDHVEVQAHENREKNAHKFRFRLIQGLIDEDLEFLVALVIVIWVPTRVNVLIFGSLSSRLTLTEQLSIVVYQCL